MESIRNLVEYVVKGGNMAWEEQAGVNRDIKHDGSVVTHVDKKLNDYLSEAITRLYPDANLVTEETESIYDPEKQYSFAVDPIDGTDPFSQGMPSWCVSVGLLKGLTPAAGIIYAPAWGTRGGTLIVSDLDGSVEVNGEKIEYSDDVPDSEGFQAMAGSKSFRSFDMTNFPGKIRAAGAAVISLIGPVIHSNMKISLIPRCHIWDIAAAHAIVKNYGLRTEYMNGDKIDYAPLLNREYTSDFILSGFSKYCDIAKETIRRVNKIS